MLALAVVYSLTILVCSVQSQSAIPVAIPTALNPPVVVVVGVGSGPITPCGSTTFSWSSAGLTAPYSGSIVDSTNTQVKSWSSPDTAILFAPLGLTVGDYSVGVVDSTTRNKGSASFSVVAGDTSCFTPVVAPKPNTTTTTPDPPSTTTPKRQSTTPTPPETTSDNPSQSSTNSDTVAPGVTAILVSTSGSISSGTAATPSFTTFLNTLLPATTRSNIVSNSQKHGTPETTSSNSENQTAGSSLSTHKLGPIIGGIVGGILVTVIAGIFLCLCARRARTRRLDSLDMLDGDFVEKDRSVLSTPLQDTSFCDGYIRSIPETLYSPEISHTYNHNHNHTYNFGNPGSLQVLNTNTDFSRAASPMPMSGRSSLNLSRTMKRRSSVFNKRWSQQSGSTIQLGAVAGSGSGTAVETSRQSVSPAMNQIQEEISFSHIPRGTTESTKSTGELNPREFNSPLLGTGVVASTSKPPAITIGTSTKYSPTNFEVLTSPSRLKYLSGSSSVTSNNTEAALTNTNRPMSNASQYAPTIVEEDDHDVVQHVDGGSLPVIELPPAYSDQMRNHV